MVANAQTRELKILKHICRLISTNTRWCLPSNIFDKPAEEYLEEIIGFTNKHKMGHKVNKMSKFEHKYRIAAGMFRKQRLILKQKTLLPIVRKRIQFQTTSPEDLHKEWFLPTNITPNQSLYNYGICFETKIIISICGPKIR